jgi:exodeoxyribonuclease VII small subunit
MSQTNELTFEAGYERLQTIARRLGEEEVPVSEMCDLFAEGKGLEQALTSYLDTQRERVEAIEQGKGVQSFRVVAPPTAGVSEARDVVVSRAEPAPAELRSAGSSADDDIPF